MLTFGLTHDLDLGCFMVKFWNSCISGIVGRIDVKWKGSELKRYWADYVLCTLITPMTLTLEFQGQSLKLPYLRNGMVDWHWTKRMSSHPFMTIILTSVTVVGWADVPDSDRGEFRRQCAVDISSSSLNSLTYDDEMMHKAWCSLEEVPYCFSRSSVKFQGHTAKKSSILTQIECF